MIHIDSNAGSKGDGTRFNPYCDFPILTPGESYFCVGNREDPMNITVPCTISGSMLFEAEGRTLRVDADNVILKGIKVLAHEGIGVQTVSGYGFCMHDVKVHVDATSRRACVNTQGGVPRSIVGCEFTGGSTGLHILTNDWDGKRSRILRNHIHSLDRYGEEGAGIFMSVNDGTTFVDYNYGLTIADNEIADWGENALDMVGAAKVLVLRNTFDSDGVGAVFLGRTDGSGGHSSVVKGNTFIGRGADGGTGLHTRGGTKCFIEDNTFINYNSPTWIGEYNTFNRNTFIDCVQNYRLAPGASALIDGGMVRA